MVLMDQEKVIYKNITIRVGFDELEYNNKFNKHRNGHKQHKKLTRGKGHKRSYARSGILVPTLQHMGRILKIKFEYQWILMKTN